MPETLAAAYNAGLADAAALARAAADRLASRVTRAPIRLNFAIEALDGIADAAEALRLPVAEEAAAAPIAASRPMPPIICGDPAPDGSPVAVPAGKL